MQKTIFITGTDTGVGKTVLTALLLSHLRQTGLPAFALKPFCSGGRADAELLHSLQNNDLTLDEINPCHFSEPVAPLVAARLHDRRITLRQTLRHVQQLSAHLTNPSLHHSATPILLIEGAGGLLAPLGEPNSPSQFKVQSSNHYTALDLITSLNCSVIVVAPNRLGTINHTLLTIQTLLTHNLRQIKVVLMQCDPMPSSCNAHHAIGSNPSILTELLYPIPLFRLFYLGKNLGKTARIRLFAKKHKKTLAQILA